MIIDVHYHFDSTQVDTAGIQMRAKGLEDSYAANCRVGAPVTAGQIAARLPALLNDANGDKLVRRMDEIGIDVTVGCVVDSVTRFADADTAMAANRACADWAARHPGRLIAFCGVDPRRENAPELLRRCIRDYGMRGLKWHCDLGFYPTSPEAYAVLKVAEEEGIILLTHTGPLPPPYRSKYVHPALLDDVCQDFPGLKVIAAHMGRNWWRDWAGLAQYRRNLFGDLAMWQLIAVTNYPHFCRELRSILDWCGPEAVMLGTDGPGFEAMVSNATFIQILKNLPKEAPNGIRFSEEEVEAMLGANAQRVLGL